MGDFSIEVMEENRDASQEAKVQGKLEEAIEQLTQAILLNPTSAIMYSGSLIAIASAEVFFEEERYHALGQHSCGHKRKATIKDKGGNKRTYTMKVEEEEETDDDELDLLLFFALILTQSSPFEDCWIGSGSLPSSSS